MEIIRENEKEYWHINANEVNGIVSVELMLCRYMKFGGHNSRKYYTDKGKLNQVLVTAINQFLLSPMLDETRQQLQEVKNEYSQLSLF